MLSLFNETHSRNAKSIIHNIIHNYYGGIYIEAEKKKT